MSTCNNLQKERFICCWDWGQFNTNINSLRWQHQAEVHLYFLERKQHETSLQMNTFLIRLSPGYEKKNQTWIDQAGTGWSLHSNKLANAVVPTHFAQLVDIGLWCHREENKKMLTTELDWKTASCPLTSVSTALLSLVSSCRDTVVLSYFSVAWKCENKKLNFTHLLKQQWKVEDHEHVRPQWTQSSGYSRIRSD